MGKLLSVETQFTEAVNRGFVIPIVTSTCLEDVGSFGTVGVKIEVTVPTDELVISEGFDSLDCLSNSHEWFVRGEQKNNNIAIVEPQCIDSNVESVSDKVSYQFL